MLLVEASPPVNALKLCPGCWSCDPDLELTKGGVHFPVMVYIRCLWFILMPNGMGYKILTFIHRVTHFIHQGWTFQAAAAGGGLGHSGNTICESPGELHAG